MKNAFLPPKKDGQLAAEDGPVHDKGCPRDPGQGFGQISVEADRRCNRDRVVAALNSKCCKKECLSTLSIEHSLEDRRKLSFGVDGPRSRDASFNYLKNFCLRQGMVIRKSPTEGGFRPQLYGKPVCTRALAWYLGIGRNKVNEVRRIAESGSWAAHRRYSLHCTESQIAIARAECEADRELYMARFTLHLDAVKRQRSIYYDLKMKAIQNPEEILTIIADGPDQFLTRVPHIVWSQSRSFPKFDDTCLPKLKLELVICHGRPGPNIFLYVVPPDKSHGANMVIESFERTLAVLRDTDGLPKSGFLHIQLDNPTGENKNRFVFGYFAEKVYEGHLKRVDFGFLPPGHTHEDVDMRHFQYGCALKESKFVDGHTICDIFEKKMRGHTTKEPTRAEMASRKILNTPMGRETLNPRAETMYHVRDWKARLEPYIPAAKGITTAYSFRIEKDMNSGDVVIYYKKTMSDETWRGPQVFLQSGALDKIPEPLSEAAHAHKHDPVAAEGLKKLSKEHPLLFSQKDIAHAVQLQLGTYPYLAHEDTLPRLPRFNVLRQSESSESHSSSEGLLSRPLRKKRKLEARQEGKPPSAGQLHGTAIVGKSASSDPDARALFESMKGRELKYTKPALVIVRGDGEGRCTKSNINCRRCLPSGRVLTLSELREDELPHVGLFAFVHTGEGFHELVDRRCPAIGCVVSAPDWSADHTPSAQRREASISIHWYSYDEKLLRRHGTRALKRGALQQMCVQKRKARSKRSAASGASTSHPWIDEVPADSLVAWNITLTRGRRLTRAALEFLERLGIQDLTNDNYDYAESSEASI
ncbi:hypothetical protein FOZ60_014048 [Perkinsus olseni]|uniref:DUF7869 domain-containing protein n=1 Tax=Perkinsus olseni TaxID=32597 RepID=A0A7J6N9C7_PEROL|nr:hypothetical protein FOZ60_014048 [Perkinsus olseni]